MIQSSIMEKSQKDVWLPVLFDLYYDNMRKIAPSTLPYQEERLEWLSAISPALDKEPRKIIVCTRHNALLGYIQYYTRDDLLMIEEVQIAKEYQRTLLFYRMCKYLGESLPTGIRYLEAYADKRNTNSQNLMRKLGMTQIKDEDDSPFIHLRGDLESIRKRFK